MFKQIQKTKKAEPSFSTFRFLFALSSRVLAVEQFRIWHRKANGQTNLMIISEIKIEHLQPEKSRNVFERIQKMKESRAITFFTFRFLFAISLRVFAVEKFQIRHWKDNGKTNLMIYQQLKIERLQLEISRNTFE